MSANDPTQGLTSDPCRVSFLQNALWTLGYVPGLIDGAYGPRTIEAVRTFQRHVGLVPTGEVDALTWEALASRFAVEAKETVRETPVGGTMAVNASRTGMGSLSPLLLSTLLHL